MIEQSKISYSPLGKAFEKQTKIIEDQETKQIRLYKLIKNFILKNNLNPEIVKSQKELKKWGKIDRNKMSYKWYRKFAKLKTIRAFTHDI